ncbi:hypothetical protein RvY_04500 [Ramazzottius varieornatus]|uniref:Uncharacterized protein n=1 Tax=Ramazzottius varieornatus TaxID=947166 RepID=A0A1D1UYK8_RAMVA|nr:hypothetical protein RvY_04500 [Ramazzottius varieornatus]
MDIVHARKRRRNQRKVDLLGPSREVVVRPLNAILKQPLATFTMFASENVLKTYFGSVGCSCSITNVIVGLAQFFCTGGVSICDPVRKCVTQ